jgi:hypothetical protein
MQLLELIEFVTQFCRFDPTTLMVTVKSKYGYLFLGHEATTDEAILVHFNTPQI